MVRAHRELGLPEPPIAGAPADLDSDSDRDVADAMAFFDSLSTLLASNSYSQACDLNFDARCDSSDIEHLMFFLYFHNTPAEVDFSTLPGLWSAGAKSLALFALDSLAHLHPEWATGYEPENFATKLRNILLPAPIAPPARMDIDGNGVVDLADAVLVSLGGWRGDPFSDRDGDGVYRINDLVLFVIAMREQQSDSTTLAGAYLTPELRRRLTSGETTRLLDEFSHAGLTPLETAQLQTLLKAGATLPKAAGLRLEQNSPNPFNPSTEIGFTIPPGGAHVTLSVVDIRGRQVRVLAEGYRAEGTHKVHWDGTNESGRALASGVYFCRLRSGNGNLTRKMILLK